MTKVPVKLLPSFLVERYRGWRATRYEENRAWYTRLAAEGQRPRAMVIGCCDSRVDAIALFGAEPGELFMLRNVANLAPTYKPDHEHHGTSAAIEYAVKELAITNLIILGHAQCGGIKAYMTMRDDPDRSAMGGEFMGNWLEVLSPAYDDIPEAGDEKDRLRLFEQAGVMNSISNLMTFPFVKEAVEAGDLALHGTWFDIGTGMLHVYDPESNVFAPCG